MASDDGHGSCWPLDEEVVFAVEEEAVVVAASSSSSPPNKGTPNKKRGTRQTGANKSSNKRRKRSKSWTKEGDHDNNSSQGEEEGGTPVGKKLKKGPNKPRSAVWQYFQRLFDGGQSGKCHLCGALIVCTDQNTKVLWNHLERDHPREYASVRADTPKVADGSHSGLLSRPMQPSEEGSPAKRTVRRTRSVAWQYFQRLLEGKNVAKCQMCLKELFCRDGNTKVLFHHLQKYHPVQYAAVREQVPFQEKPRTQDGFTTSVDMRIASAPRPRGRPSWLACGPEQQKVITDALLEFIVVEHLPSSIIESLGLRHLLKVVAPNYKPRSRSTMIRLAGKRFQHEKVKLLADLQACGNYSLTVEQWKDECHNESHFSLTIHYLDGEDLRSAPIAILPYNETYMADQIALQIQTVMSDWKLDCDKVVTVTTSHCENVSCAAKATFGTQKWIPCIGQTINTYVNDAISAVDEVVYLLSEVKRIVAYFKDNKEAMEELLYLQGQANCGDSTEVLEAKVPLKLKRESDKRLNSKFIMLERFNTLKRFVASAVDNLQARQDLRKRPAAMLSEELFPVLEDTVSLLRPFFDLTEHLSAESYPTGGMIIPELKLICDDLESVTGVYSQTGLLLLMSLKNLFLPSFSVYFTHQKLQAATFLDPRFKSDFFEEHVIHSTLAYINQHLRAHNTHAMWEEVNREPAPEQSNTKRSMADRFTAFKKKNNLGAIMPPPPSSSSGEGYEASLAAYNNIPSLNDFKISPMKYWNNYVSDKYSKDLEASAKEHLVILATSMPSDRLFSKPGQLRNERKNMLSETHLLPLLFLAHLYKRKVEYAKDIKLDVLV